MPATPDSSENYSKSDRMVSGCYLGHLDSFDSVLELA